MKYAVYLVSFMVAQILVTGSVAVLVARNVIDQYDTSTKPETTVIRESAWTKSEPDGNLGRMAFDNERPVVKAGWKAGTTERIGGADCTPAVGPNGEEVVVVEFDAGLSMSDAESAVYAMMAKGGWKKSDAEYMSMWKAGRTASIKMLPDRVKTTYAIGTGWGERSARESADAFAK